MTKRMLHNPVFKCCGFCTFFFRSPPSKSGRICIKTERFVSADKKINCKYYQLYRFFYCEKKSIWLTFSQCKNRINKQITGCSAKCRQYQKNKFSYPKRVLVSKNKHKINWNPPVFKKRVKKPNRAVVVSIGKKMLQAFGESPWMKKYPEIFKVERKLFHKKEEKNDKTEHKKPKCRRILHKKHKNFKLHHV